MHKEIHLPNKSLLLWASFLGCLGVGLGAFGAHLLKEMLQETGREGTWETAVFYHLLHVVVLLWLAQTTVKKGVALWFLVGIFLFSGSLYVYCLTELKFLVRVTPLGGICLLLGWGGLFVEGMRKRVLRTQEKE